MNHDEHTTEVRPNERTEQPPKIYEEQYSIFLESFAFQKINAKNLNGSHILHVRES